MFGVECIEKFIRKIFQLYGSILAKYHYFFIIATLIVTVILGSGIALINFDNEVQKLFTPTDAKSRNEWETYATIFLGVGDENSLPNRLIDDTRMGQIIFQSIDVDGVLTKNVMDEILQLHHSVMSITVFDDNGFPKKFGDICLKWDGQCLEHAILDFYDFDADNVNSRKATYHYAKKPSGKMVNLQSDLGDVSLQADGKTIKYAKALRLIYFLRAHKEKDDKLSAKWEKSFQKIVRDFPKQVTSFVSATSALLDEEVDATIYESVVKFLPITFAILFIFTTAACMMANWVLSKPWLGIAAIVTVVLSLCTSFGILCYAGYPICLMAGAAPFLILGIGLDDAFVAISAWRQTDAEDTVEERLSETLSEAGTSITITSLTDLFAFAIGISTNFLAIKYFCAYCTVSVLFCYIYQLTFFIPCLAISGYREEEKQHGCCCCYNTDHYIEETGCLRVFCARCGCPRNEISPEGQTNEQLEVHAITSFLQKCYGPCLNATPFVVIVIVLYFAYLGISIWGCTLIERGMDEDNLLREGSEAKEFVEVQSKYFGQFGPQIVVMVTNEVAYWDRDIQYSLERTLSEMEDNPHIFAREHSEVWFRDYLLFLQAQCLLPLPYKSQFIDVLRQSFLKQNQFKKYSLDIIFSANNMTILASRFFLRSEDLDNQELQSQLTSNIRRIASKSSLSLTVYSSIFSSSDQYNSLWSTMWTTIGWTLAVMFIVSLCFIPYFTCALLVTYAIMSILTGVLGFMGFWHISLSPISMINLIVCIGFSVDFSAHVCYAFVTHKAKVDKDASCTEIQLCCCECDSLPNKPTNKERSIYSIYNLGLPILQGALSTVVAILPLAFSPAYVFSVFFKTMFLVMNLGALHGLVFLPIALRIIVGEGERILGMLLENFAMGLGLIALAVGMALLYILKKIIECVACVVKCIYESCEESPGCTCCGILIALSIIGGLLSTIIIPGSDDNTPLNPLPPVFLPTPDPSCPYV